MKKSILAFMLVITMILCLTSCGKDKELTARVDSLEVNVKELTARVDSLESKVKELEEFKLSDSFYGSIYKIDLGMLSSLSMILMKNARMSHIRIRTISSRVAMKKEKMSI